MGRLTHQGVAVWDKDCWIVNLVENQMEIYRDPEVKAAATYGYAYRAVEVRRPGDSIAPLARPDAIIAVADLLP